MAWGFSKAVNQINAGNATTVVKVFGSAVAAAALIVGSVTFGLGSGAASFADDVNGAWGGTVYTVNDSGNNQSISTSFIANSAAGTPTVTATFASCDHSGGIYSEYSGVATSSPIDGTPSGQAQGNGTTHTSPTVTVSQAGDLVYGFIVEDTVGTRTISGSGGLTIHANQGPAIVNSVNIAAGDKNGPASGTVTAAFGFSATAGAIIQCLCFKAAAAGTKAPIFRHSSMRFARR